MIDHLARFDANVFDDGRGLGGERGLHFHRFDYDQGLARVD